MVLGVVGYVPFLNTPMAEASVSHIPHTSPFPSIPVVLAAEFLHSTLSFFASSLLPARWSHLGFVFSSSLSHPSACFIAPSFLPSFDGHCHHPVTATSHHFALPFCSLLVYPPTDRFAHSFTPVVSDLPPHSLLLNVNLLALPRRSLTFVSSRYMLHDVHCLASPAAPIRCHVGLPLSQLLYRLPSAPAPS